MRYAFLRFLYVAPIALLLRFGNDPPGSPWPRLADKEEAERLPATRGKCSYQPKAPRSGGEAGTPLAPVRSDPGVELAAPHEQLAGGDAVARERRGRSRSMKLRSVRTLNPEEAASARRGRYGSSRMLMM